MNFLSLCQEVARESGTISGTLPSSTVGQSGRLLLIVGWTNSAWRRIQNRRPDWRFLKKQFSGTTIANTRAYTGASFGLTDHAEWLTQIAPGAASMSIYLTTDGVATERDLPYVDYASFYIRFMRGAQISGYPYCWTISDDNEVLLGPIPDGSYTIKGFYRRTPQDLSANADIPILPERFHGLIPMVALTELAEFDEAPTQFQTWTMRKRELNAALERDCLPEITRTRRAIA